MCALSVVAQEPIDVMYIHALDIDDAKSKKVVRTSEDTSKFN